MMGRNIKNDFSEPRFGAGLRPKHYPSLLEKKSTVIDWFEIISENFMTTKGRPRWILEQIRKDYPLAFHGVSLSIAGPEPINFDYLRKLKTLIEDFDPFLVSDHFCWTGTHSANTHNLLPFPLNKKMLDHIVPRINLVQDFLGQTILLENASAYMQFEGDEMSEWSFITEVCNKTDCHLLLDINNLYVSNTNFGQDPHEALLQVPHKRVKQIHLAGHSDMGAYLFDTHSQAVQEPVWQLYRSWLQLRKNVPTMIEWDDQIPPLEVLEAEVNKIKFYQHGTDANVNSKIRETQYEL